ncbi:uncharacterized protein LOC125930414 [Panthera uncia]|uniref:uncharacterized protein LOC125930414 n=1 Tax=Panthera uncia TaxID=29064 RepID=UPI0020FF9A15|nr:uncharacterized protein LOC125930414 [Panthera uncia]
MEESKTQTSSRPTPPPGVPAPFSSSEAAAIFRPRRIAAAPRRPLATPLSSPSHCRGPGPERESLRRPAGTGWQQGGRTGSTGRSGPGGGWDLKVPSHLLPVLGPGTLEEPGWRLQKIPGWRKQPRARVAAAGVSERDKPPETELRPRPAPSPRTLPLPRSAPSGLLCLLAARVTSDQVGARKKVSGNWSFGTVLGNVRLRSAASLFLLGNLVFCQMTLKRHVKKG